MRAEKWRERQLGGTRGGVVEMLRREPRTIKELAGELDVTGNAIRGHIAALERDGLVRQEGVRRGIGKPAHVFALTPQAEGLFPKAYAAVLGRVLALLRERDGERRLEELLRAAGRQTAREVANGNGSVRERARRAAAVLGEMGGLAEVEERDDALTLRGYSCPLAAVAVEQPEVCAFAEALVSEILDREVQECCERGERGERPRCAFSVLEAAEAG